MTPSDTELHETLLRHLVELGDVDYHAEAGTVSLRGFPDQRAPQLHLHLTPEQLGRAVRDLAPDYGAAFPLLSAEDSTLLVLWLDVLVAVQHAGPNAVDLIVPPLDAAARRTRARARPRRFERHDAARPGQRRRRERSRGR